MAGPAKGSVAGEWIIGAGRASTGQLTELLLRDAVLHGYSTAAAGPRTFRFARSYRPTWAVVATAVGCFFCFLGLFFLMVKTTETFDATVTDDRDGVKLRLSGTIRSSLLASLQAQLSAVQPSHPAGDPAGAVGAPMPQPPIDPPPAAPSFFLPPPPLANSGTARTPDSPTPSPAVAPTADATIARVRPVDAPGETTLVLASGRRVAVGPGVLIGRDPQPTAEAPLAITLAIPDPTLSRTHLLVESSAAGVWVTDQHSTNGVTLSFGGVERRCSPGERIELPIGGRAEFGESSFTVEA